MTNSDFYSLRTNGIIGVIQTDDRNVHATEWWSGEGIDFTFEDNTASSNIIKKIELHIDEIADLIALALAMGFVDLDEVTEKSEVLKTKSKKDQEFLERLRTS